MERLSDGRLRKLHYWARNLGTTEGYDTADTISEIFALRAKLAAGPVMPEVPSDSVIYAIEVEKDRGVGGAINFYRAIRAALLKEQSR